MIEELSAQKKYKIVHAGYVTGLTAETLTTTMQYCGTRKETNVTTEEGDWRTFFLITDTNFPSIIKGSNLQ